MIQKSEIFDVAGPPDSRTGHRANLYRLLAECYRYPVLELGSQLALLEKEACALAPNLGACAKQLRRKFPQSGDIKQLEIAYSRLFIGPRELIAPPYGSVYLEQDRRVMGDTTLEVMSCYAHAGLTPSRDNKEPPDHISTEMEFMYYLGFEYLRFRDQTFADKQREFFLRYLDPWVTRFATHIARSQTHPFYDSLAEVTRDFMFFEAKLFNATPRELDDQRSA